MSSSRRERRARDRETVKAAEARLRLAKREPGGAVELPIVVESASLVEPKALGIPCPACGGEVRVEEHAALFREAVRDVRVRCKECGVARSVFVRVAQPN